MNELRMAIIGRVLGTKPEKCPHLLYSVVRFFIGGHAGPLKQQSVQEKQTELV